MGVAKGAEFRVNAVTASDQGAPSVVMAADDSFTIVWQSNNQDGSNWGVYGQRYSADGDLNMTGGEGDVLGAPQLERRGSGVTLRVQAPPALSRAEGASGSCGTWMRE